MAQKQKAEPGKKLWVKIIIGIIGLFVLTGLGIGVVYFQKAQKMNVTLAQLVPDYIPAYVKIDRLPDVLNRYLHHPFWSMNENQEPVKRVRYIYKSTKELISGGNLNKETEKILNQQFDVAVTGIDYPKKKISFLAATDIGKYRGVLGEWFPSIVYNQLNKNLEGEKSKIQVEDKILWKLSPEGIKQSLYYCLHKNLLLVSSDQTSLEKAVTDQILKENQLIEDQHYRQFVRKLSAKQNMSLFVRGDTVYNDLVNHGIVRDELGLVGRMTGIRNIEALCITSRFDKKGPVENIHIMVPEKSGLIGLLHNHAGADKTAAVIPEHSTASVSFSLKEPSELMWNSLDLAEQGKNMIYPGANIPDIRKSIKMIQSFSGIKVDNLIDNVLEGGISLYTDDLTSLKNIPRYGLVKYSKDPLKLDRLIKTIKDFSRDNLNMRFTQTDDYKGDLIYKAESSDSSFNNKTFYFIAKGNYFLLATAKDMLIDMIGKLQDRQKLKKEDQPAQKNFLTVQARTDRYLSYLKQEDPQFKKELMDSELQDILIPDDLAPCKIDCAKDKNSFHIRISPGLLIPSVLTGLAHQILTEYHSEQKIVFEEPGSKKIEIEPMFCKQLGITYSPESAGVLEVNLNASEALSFDLGYKNGASYPSLPEEKKSSATYRYYVDSGKESLSGQNWICRYDTSLIKTIELELDLKQTSVDALKAKTLWSEPVTGMEFVWVPSGCYQMGQTKTEKQYLIDERGKEKYNKYYTYELPRHEVCVDGFWMAKYEVTNRQYRLFDSGHSSKDLKGVDLSQDSQPVVNVSWEDAQKFIEWLNRKTGQEFSLPTEAQWEYAARADTDTIRFWGDSPDEACRYANVHDHTSDRKFGFSWPCHDCSDGYAGSAPRGSFKPNDFGLYDMLGNVWEWCQDVYDKDAYSKHARNNPLITSGSSRRVGRGGSWGNFPGFVRAASRGGYPADYACISLGFRLCLSRVR